jgi:hypothetical protein
MEGGVAALIPLAAARITPGSGSAWLSHLVLSLTASVRDSPPWRRPQPYQGYRARQRGPVYATDDATMVLLRRNISSLDKRMGHAPPAERTLR